MSDPDHTSSWYHFSTETVHSDVALPSLPAARETHEKSHLRITDTCFREAPVPITRWDYEWLDRSGAPTLQLVREPPYRRLRVPGFADFVIDQAVGAIRIERLPGLDEETLEHLLIDQILPRLLTGQGAFVLHAGAVQIGENCVLFLGDTGWGKSTLVGLLQQRGAQPLTDDCVVLATSDRTTRAIPTYPSLRLLPDSLAEIAAASDGLKSVAAYTRKRRIPMRQAPACALGTGSPPVAAIYFINDPTEPVARLEITKLSPAAACVTLLGNIFRLDPPAPTDAGRLLQEAATVIAAVPTYRLAYPRSYETAGAVADTVLAHARATRVADPKFE